MARLSVDQGSPVWPRSQHFALVAAAFACQGQSWFCCARLSRDRFTRRRAPQCWSAKPLQTQLMLLENEQVS